MRKSISLTIVLAVALLAGSAAAQERKLDDLRLEHMALTDSISAQIRLLEIYERIGKAAEAETTKKRIWDLLNQQRRVMNELGQRMVGQPAAAARPRVGPPRIPEPVKAEWPRRLKVAKPRRFFESGAEGLKVAVARALDWFKVHQSQEGLWDCDGFYRHSETDQSVAGAGHALYDGGVTGLALLAFLGAGETHKSGEYKATVKNGLKYLKQIQDPEGCFGPRTSNHFLYNHAIAALAMTEAYALTGSPLFLESSQRAADFIHKAQNPYLAWRYGVRPGDNDTSVTGWMVAALHSARNAGLRLDNAAFDGAAAWLDKVTEPEYGRVGYTFRGSGPARPQELIDKFPSDRSESLTAEGIMTRIHLGEDPKKSELIQKGADLVLKVPPVWNEARGDIDMYYWFWGTQAMHHVGGQAWRAWKKPMREVALSSQRTDGTLAGSWDPVGPWGRDGGRIYSTALMTIILEIVGRD